MFERAGLLMYGSATESLHPRFFRFFPPQTSEDLSLLWIPRVGWGVREQCRKNYCPLPPSLPSLLLLRLKWNLEPAAFRTRCSQEVEGLVCNQIKAGSLRNL